MSELEASLREKSTPELQAAISNNTLIESASVIARQILTERQAEIPTPKSEDQIEAEGRSFRYRSTVAAITLLACFGLYLYTNSYYSLLPFLVVLAMNKRAASS